MELRVMSQGMISKVVNVSTESETVSQLLSVIDSSQSKRLSWGLLFCGDKLDGASIFQSISQALIGIPLWGGSLNGGIAYHQPFATGFESFLLLFDDSVTPPFEQIFALSDGSNDAEKIALLKTTIFDEKYSPHLLCLGAQQHNVNSHRSMSDVIAELSAGLTAATELTITGAQLSAAFGHSPSPLFTSKSVAYNSVVALVLSNETQLLMSQTMNAVVSSSFMKVTKGQGNVIQEINGCAALSYIKQQHLTHKQLDLPCYLGRKFGDLYDTRFDNSYQIYSIQRVDEDTGELTVFPADISDDDHLQVMLSSENIHHLDKHLVAPQGAQHDITIRFYLSSTDNALDKELCTEQANQSEPPIPKLEVAAEITQLDGKHRMTVNHQTCISLSRHHKPSANLLSKDDITYV